MKKLLLCLTLTSIQLIGMQPSLHEICSPQNDSLETEKINERAQTLLALLKSGANVNERGFRGRSPIFSLAIPYFQNLCHKVVTRPCDDPEFKKRFIDSRITLIGILLANGADITLKDDDDKTVLQKAEECDDDNFNFENGMVFRNYIRNYSFQATPHRHILDVLIVNRDPLSKPDVQVNIKRQ